MLKSCRVAFTVVLTIVSAVLLTSRQSNGMPGIMVGTYFTCLAVILLMVSLLWNKEIREIIKDLLQQQEEADAVDWRQQEGPDRRAWISAIQAQPRQRQPRCMAIREDEPTQPLF